MLATQTRTGAFLLRAPISHNFKNYRLFGTSRRLQSDIAFVFDIDGVLLRGSKALDSAKPTLELLNDKKIPFILLTNGGGVSEKARVDYISEEVGVRISPLQIVQSHTPMKVLAKNKTYNRVLVVGGPDDKARHVALDYGFEDVITPGDIIRQTPALSPHHRYTADQFEKFTVENADLDTPLDAILVFNDPRDAGTDLQVVSDLLNSDGGRIGTRRSVTNGSDKQEPSIPILFSNNDFLWANDYPLPRFGQGAFRIAVEALYSEFNQLKPHEKLRSTIFGKPFKVQYDFAHSVLIDWRSYLLGNKTHGHDDINLPSLNETPQNTPFKSIYMVGDNPASDIQGANENGWKSLLLRTGVYRDEDWDTIVAKPTDGIHDNVYESVTYALKENGHL